MNHLWRKAFQRPEPGPSGAGIANEPDNRERVYRPKWSVDSPGTVDVTPRLPIHMIVLGPDDQSGGVRIYTDEVDGPGYVTVGPNAPYFGRLTKKFTIQPMLSSPTGCLLKKGGIRKAVKRALRC